MCLDLSIFPFLRRRKTAKKPIKVYKLATKCEPNQENGVAVYTTPFQRYQYIVGETSVSSLLWSKWDQTRIEKGIHSLVKFENAVKIAHALHDRYINVSVLECEIPVGAEYYVGGWEFSSRSYKSIASDSLKVVREVLIPAKRRSFLDLIADSALMDRFI